MNKRYAWRARYYVLEPVRGDPAALGSVWWDGECWRWHASSLATGSRDGTATSAIAAMGQATSALGVRLARGRPRSALGRLLRWLRHPREEDERCCCT